VKILSTRPHQEEGGAEVLPADPPVEAGPEAEHLVNVLTELVDPCTGKPEKHKT